MIQLNMQCVHCGKSLMDESNKIDNYPSIALVAGYGKKKGKLYLSSLYGSYHIDIRIPCPTGKIAQFFCPHCKKELKTIDKCNLCGAPIVSFAFVEGGALLICSRRGCKRHLVEFEDLEQELKTFYNKYSLFFK